MFVLQRCTRFFCGVGFFSGFHLGMVQDGKCNVSFRVRKVALYEWMVVVDFFTVLL